MNAKGQCNYLRELGWELRRITTGNKGEGWSTESVTDPSKRDHFATLTRIDEYLKEMLRVELACQNALQEFEVTYARCSAEDRANLELWMSNGQRGKVWHLTNDCIRASHLVPELPRRWRPVALALLPSRLNRPYEELWKRAADRFQKVA